MTTEPLARVRHAFDERATSVARSAFHQDEVRARRLVHFAGIPQGARVLDVGCGPGPLLSHLVRQGARAVGVDLSRPMLDLARETRATALQADMESLPFREGAFDVVVTRTTLHHVPAPDAGVWEMRRVVKRGGTIVVEDALTSVQPGIATRHNEMERLRDTAHQRFLSVSALAGLLEEAGFEIEAVEVVTHERELEEWMDVAMTPEASRVEIRRRFDRDVKDQMLGLASRKDGGRVLFDLRHAMVKGVKR